MQVTSKRILLVIAKKLCPQFAVYKSHKNLLRRKQRSFGGGVAVQQFQLSEIWCPHVGTPKPSLLGMLVGTSCLHGRGCCLRDVSSNSIILALFTGWSYGNDLVTFVAKLSREVL